MSDAWVEEFDFVIVGIGLGNSILGFEFDYWKIVIVEKDFFGGICLNVGCIFLKMFVYVVDVVEIICNVFVYGIDVYIINVDWVVVWDCVFGWIDLIVEGGESYWLSDECFNIMVFKGEGCFVDKWMFEVIDLEGRVS